MEIRIAIITGSHVGTSGDSEVPGRILLGVITDSPDVQNIDTCQAGEEFNPPNGCRAIVVAGGNSYKLAAAVDDGIAPAMAPGGKRIYSTDAEGAAEAAEVRLLPDGEVQVFNDNAHIIMKPDGKVEVVNGAASFTMGADGQFVFHGIGSHFDHPVTMAETLAVAGAVTAPTIAGTTDVTFAGKSAVEHVHSGVEPGDGETGAPV